MAYNTACMQSVNTVMIGIFANIYKNSIRDAIVAGGGGGGAWFSEVCSGRKTQETAVSKLVKCKMRNTCL